MKLRRQGFYREMPHGNEDDPSILLYIRDKSDKEERIYQYLNEGIVLVSCGGIVKDVVNPDNGIAGCPDILTDGVWMWPGDLAYYVKKYHLELGKEVVQGMEDSGWHIRNIFGIDYDNLHPNTQNQS